MRLLKLGLISLVAFYLLIWIFSMLFPNSTVLSRVINIAGTSDSLRQQITSNHISFRQWLIPDSGNFDVRTSDISFYENNLFNMEPQPNADTIYFELRQEQQMLVQGGLGFYQLRPDSVTTQLFYVFKTKWYKPWEKMALMLADKQYGPQMDHALQQLKEVVE